MARAHVLRAPRPADRGHRALAARPAHRRSGLTRLRARPRRPGRLVGLDRAQPRGARVLRRPRRRLRRAAVDPVLGGLPARPRRAPPSRARSGRRGPRAVGASTARSTARCSSATARTAHLRQGLDDDARPLDVQALGILWLLGQGRHADARGGRAHDRRDDARRGPPRRLAGSGRADVHRLPPVRRRVGPGRALDGGDADHAPRQGAARPRRQRRSTTAPTAGPR